jgi:microsomal dipeptidase-like Zn-dependent dipeptidase
VADLQKLAEPLDERGYRQEQIAAILGGNWLRILKTALPE